MAPSFTAALRDSRNAGRSSANGLAATLPLYFVAMRRIIDNKTALLATLGFPAVAVNFLHGQNGFLTAALIGGGKCER